MNYLLGIDLGTSSTKTILFDENGCAVSSSSAEYPLYQPRNGWAEQDPADWWDAVVRTIRAVLEQSRIAPADIAAIGVSGQMHGLVMLDGDGNVLRRSIIWCDGRTTEECREITDRIGAQRLIEITANPALPGFTASKILWVRRHEPELYAKCRHILLPKDYISYQLTGQFVTEVSDASGMNLMDVKNRCWSNEVLEGLAISRELLPQMHESCDITGFVSPAAARVTGLVTGIPVAGGAGDNAAAAVGTGVVETGKALTTLGTSGVIFAHADTLSIEPDGRVHTFCAAVPGAWAVLSCTLAAGLSLRWLRDNFFKSETESAIGMGMDPYHLLDQQAGRIPIGANRLIYLPYLMGERSPILNEDSRGVFFGLSAIHSKYDLLRAVMEGVIYSQRDCLDVLRKMGSNPDRMIVGGGGGTSPFWRQMLADVISCPVVTTVNREGPALGAAILAGVGAKRWPSVPEACKAVIHIDQFQQPLAENHDRYEKTYAVYRALYPRLKDLYTDLKAL